MFHFLIKPYGILDYDICLTIHSNFPFIAVNNKDVYDLCHYARQRNFYIMLSIIDLHPYDMIHFDIWGPLVVKSSYGHSYFLTVVDDCSRCTWITLMKSKSETRQHVINFF